MDLTDKVALVTGGSRGIGRGICLRLAEAGARVVVGYRSGADDASQVVKAVADAGRPQAQAQFLDVDDPRTVDRAVAAVLSEHGRVDVLVNNAGTGHAASVLDVDAQDWTQPVRTNLFGSYACIRAVSLAMLVARSGSIVNVTSVAAFLGVPGLSSYCASKAGVVAMTRALSREFAPHGVRVNGVAPGFTDETGMVARIDDASMADFMGRIALQRLARPREIANAVCFLASEEASYVTGQTLVVDGGFIA